MRIPLNVQPYAQEFEGVRIYLEVEGEIDLRQQHAAMNGIAAIRRAVDDTMTALGMTDEARCVPCGKKAEEEHGVRA